MASKVVLFHDNKRGSRAKQREEYHQNRDDELESSCVWYNADLEQKQVAARDSYRTDPENVENRVQVVGLKKLFTLIAHW